MEKKTITLNEREMYSFIYRIILFVLAKLGVQREGYVIAYHQKNSTSTPPTNSNCNSWAEYWEQLHTSHHFPYEPHICPSCLRERNEFIGGHLQIGQEYYIHPMCKHCNDTYKFSKADAHPFYVKMEDTVRAPKD